MVQAVKLLQFLSSPLRLSTKALLTHTARRAEQPLLPVLRHNVASNAAACPGCCVAELDWARETHRARVCGDQGSGFQAVVAADVIYEQQGVAPFVRTLEQARPLHPTACEATLGACEGDALGACDGAMLGACEGTALGACEGDALGACDGAMLGACEGTALGACEATALGACEGTALGACEGDVLGACD
jgi:hypothetical protein